MSGSPYFCPPFFASASCQPLYYPYPASSSYGPSVSLVPPPPTFSFFPPPTAQRGSTTPFTPSVIAIIGILGAAFLLVSYYTIVAKYCTSRGLFRRQRGSRDAREDAGPNDAAWPMLTRGLEESVIKIIPVCKYAKGDGLIEGTECAVCLSEFEEDEALRLLPKCSHAFHLPCIDKWLQSHSNCPLCRANIMSPIPVPTPAQQSLSAAVEDVAPNNSSQPQPVNGSLEEQEGHSERSNRHLPDQAPEDRDSTQAVASGQAFTDPGTEGETGNHSDNQTKALEMLQREEKISGRYSDGLYAAERVLYFAQMRSFSAGIAMSESHESRPNHSDSKVQGGWREKAGSSNPSYFTRSYSTGSFSRNAVVELPSNQEWEQRCMNTARSGKAALPVYEMQALLTLKDSNCGSSEDAAPAGLHVVVDVAGATGSSSRQIATDDSKSKSFRHESGLKNKADAAGGGDPLMGKMLQSLSKGPFGMRRSFSSGRRIFAFMNSRGRNTAEFENNAESLA